MAGKRFGGFWRRFLAFWVDQFILLFLTRFLYGFGLPAIGWRPYSNGLASNILISSVFMLLISAAYFTWFHGLFGWTPGKKLLRLKVIQVSGKSLTLGIAFLRWVGSLISALPLWFGYLWVAFDSRKQGWHDKIAATLVIRAEDCRLSEATRLSPAGRDVSSGVHNLRDHLGVGGPEVFSVRKKPLTKGEHFYKSYKIIMA